jgi:Invasion associated locus B (IalB) protein
MKLTPVGRAAANVPSRRPPPASRRKDHDVWCLTTTCIAADLADPRLIKKMETDQKLQPEVADSSVLAVTTALPVNRFAAVRQGIPMQMFEQTIAE